MTSYANGISFGGDALGSLYYGDQLLTKVADCEDTIFAPEEQPFTADVLIIGGGGGGGGGQGGGGGGGGGYREFTKKYYTGTSYAVTIGAGGSTNSNGSDSSIEKIGSGGGAGGNAQGATQEACNGKDGGSGGGTGLTSNTAFRKTSGGNSLSPRCNGSSQGYPGFAGPIELCSSGGAGGTGSNSNGGPGKTSTITGTSVGRSGGGAPAFGSYSATDGGGTANQNGTTNTGGGGGGGANGGSGFICIKFPDTITITVGGGLTYTSSTSGGYTTVQFTAGTDTIEFFWNPKTYGGLELWLDSNDSETITLNGGTVSQWNDKSGNDYHVSQGTASNQPTYVTSVLNNRNIVRFDGINDIMSNGSAQPVAGSSNRTIFCVFSCNTTFTGSNSEYGLYFGLASPANGGFIAITQELAVRVAAGYKIFNQSNDDGSHAIISAVQNGTNVSDYSMWKNGSALSATTTLSRELNTGAGISVGAHPVMFNWLDGDIAEIIVYSSALSASQRQQVESYLSNKWGIS